MADIWVFRQMSTRGRALVDERFPSKRVIPTLRKPLAETGFGGGQT